jgi:hypothetical protein
VLQPLHRIPRGALLVYSSYIFLLSFDYFDLFSDALVLADLWRAAILLDSLPAGRPFPAWRRCRLLCFFVFLIFVIVQQCPPPRGVRVLVLPFLLLLCFFSSDYSVHVLVFVADFCDHQPMPHMDLQFEMYSTLFTVICSI